jgi:hypothetical protein
MSRVCVSHIWIFGKRCVKQVKRLFQMTIGQWFKENATGVRKVFNTLAISGALIYCTKEMAEAMRDHADAVSAQTEEIRDIRAQVGAVIEQVEGAIQDAAGQLGLGGEFPMPLMPLDDDDSIMPLTPIDPDNGSRMRQLPDFDLSPDIEP